MIEQIDWYKLHCCVWICGSSLQLRCTLKDDRCTLEDSQVQSTWKSNLCFSSYCVIFLLKSAFLASFS